MRRDVAAVGQGKAASPTLNKQRQGMGGTVVAILAVLIAGGLLHGPAIVQGRVLLPADIVLLMRPWAPVARERFPDFRFAQNQLLGPIFEYYTWRHYSRSRIRAGEVPLWNPYEMGGNVLLANSQSAVLYPPNLLLYVLPLWVGINLITLFHTWVTGLLMLGFLRTLGLRHAAAAAGAVTWMLCGCLIVWTEFQTPTAALCWLPGALWACEKGWALRGERQVARGKGGRLGEWTCYGAAAMALALSLVAGHPQFAFYVVLSTVLYMLIRFGWRSLLVSAGVIAFAGALGAVTLLPVAEASRTNHRRKDVSYTEAVKLRLPPIHLTSALLPNIRGNPRDYVRISDGEARPGNPYIGPYDFTEYCLYVGIPALILACIGIGTRWRERPALAMGTVGTVGLALALGTPIGAVFFYLVPGYAQFHAPARAVSMVHFALAALAAFGLDAALRTGEGQEAGGKRQQLGAAVSAAIALLCVAAWPLTGLQLPEVMSADWLTYAAGSIRHAVLFAAAAGGCLWWLSRGAKGEGGRAKAEGRGLKAEGAAMVLVALCAADLLIWGAGYNPATDPQMLEAVPDRASIPRPKPWERAISFETPEAGTKSLIVPNFNVVVGYREVQGADSVHTRRYHLAMQSVAEGLSERRPVFPDANTVRVPAGHHSLLDLLNVVQATTLPSSGPPAPHYILESEGELSVWRNPRAMGPGRVVAETRQVRDVIEAIATIGSPSHDLARIATVEGQHPQIGSLRPEGELNAEATVAVRTFEPHRVVYDIVSPASGLFVAAEPAYPGWKATVLPDSGGRGSRRADGTDRDARVYVADGILRGVVVPSGRSAVTFRYEPVSFRLGLFLSLFACGVLGAPAAAAAYGLRAEH